MQHKDLPARWQEKIAAYLASQGNSTDKQFGAADFNTSKQINIRFEDGSFARFNYAFVIKAPEWREVAVFTEHCGYHIFSIYVEIEETER